MHLFPQGSAALSQVQALAGQWDLTRGMHPHLAGMLGNMASLPVMPTSVEAENLLQLDLPLMPVTHGHHVVRDAGFIAAATPLGGLGSGEDEYPLAPVFVRDLCGRIIHTGLMPLPAAPTAPVFPSGCDVVTEGMPGAHLIENAIFTTYRRLECSPTNGVRLAGQPELALQALYPQPSAYPYKLRPDTFYADGWRVPQVARVFARKLPPVQVQQVVADFMQKWQQRPSGQGYEDFYDVNNGAAWFTELFEKGCTIIPTVEAYNGRYHVADDYTAQEVDPGRAVPGLHVVVEERDSEFPVGTILEVVEPGWVTATGLQPAKVVVSNGKGFKPLAAPEASLPDLTLPHPRVSPVWGAVWLPTHPQHFAEPALWDWDASGHFIQVSGPLWDPVHYVYTSTAMLCRAHRKPLAEAPALFEMNEKLRATFHPLAEMTWYDTISERTLQQRAEDAAHPLYGSAVDQVPMGSRVAGIGYYALPLGLEYELDPAHFPNRHPRHRVQPCQPQLAARVVRHAEVMGGREIYARHHVTVTEPFRVALAAAEAAPVRDDFAILLAPQSSPTAVTIPAWLPEVPASQLFINVKRLFASRAYRQALQQAASALGAGQLPAALYQFREAALAWRRLRYRLFTKYPATWQNAWLEGLDINTAEAQVAVHDDTWHQAVKNQRAALLSVKSVPALVAGGLPSRDTPVKLHRNTRKVTTAGTATGR